jgi:hypothetical protein
MLPFHASHSLFYILLGLLTVVDVPFGYLTIDDIFLLQIPVPTAWGLHTRW